MSFARFYPTRLSFPWFIFLLLALVLFAHIWLIHSMGSALPFWDQWGAQAGRLFIPWLDHHTLSWQTLFAAHNEHRIAFARLLTLFLFIINQQWDPLLEMTVNALLHTLNAGLLILLLRPLLSPSERIGATLLIALLWMVPFGWENTLAGFQSPFYLLVTCSLVTLWGLLLHRVNSGPWWLGILAAVAANFCLASGFFMVVVVGILALYMARVETKTLANHVVTVLVCFILIGLAVGLLVDAPHHASLKAHSAAEFGLAFAKALAWPWPQYYVGIWLQLPLLVLALRTLWRRGPLDKLELVTLALGGWVMLQAIGAAYARGAGGVPPASRYMDLLAIGAIANYCAILVLTRNATFPQRWARAWIALLLTGLFGLTLTQVIAAVEEKHRINLIQEANVHQYLIRQDRRILQEAPFLHIPYPVADHLGTWLDHPGLRSRLAANIQVPVALAGEESQAFAPNGFYPSTGTYRGETAVGSYGAHGNAAVGVFRSLWQTPLPQRYLQIPVSGYLGEDGLQLVLETQDGTRTSIRVEKPPKETWQLVTIRNPGVPYRLVAEDNNPNLWFAFAAPHGEGALSHWNRHLLAASPYLFVALFFLVLLGLPECQRRTD